MLFELRDSIPQVSDAWVDARDLFLRGQTRAAWDAAMALRGKGQLASANDYLLNIELARACSADRLYKALVRCAMREFPDDPFVQLYYARVLLTLSRQTEAIEFLLARENTLGQTHRAYWGTELASVYASAGFEKSGIRWLETVSDEPGFDSALALYTRSCVRHGLQQWDEAIDRAEQCLAVAPNWTRVRGYLVSCLLARGRIDAAEEQIAKVVNGGYQEAMIDVVAAMLPMSLGRFERARPLLEALLREWPQAGFLLWVRRALCLMLVELGEYEAARDLANGEEQELGLPSIPKHGGGSHRHLPLPLIAQHRNQCVPTTVAMAVYPQGHHFDPDVLFREMHGREGTPLWRMREWCQTHGFHVVPIRLEKEAVVAMLEADVPLIGTLEGPFNSHVEVVCGFNTDLDTLYVRDPEHWAPIAWPSEAALARYTMYAGLLAVIDADRADLQAIPIEWRSDECEALLDLASAAARGDTAAAEAAYARVPDDSPAASIRDGYAVNVVISPERFRERMRLTSRDESVDGVARFRAMMSLGSDDVDQLLAKLLESDESQYFSAGARRYLKLLVSMNKGDWPSARGLIERLLLRGCGVARFWELKSDILAELGQHDASRGALERAIELEPLRVSTREKALNRAASRLTLDEYVSELDALLAEDASDKRLLISRAAVLYDGPDGRAYEGAARDAIRWFPRMPTLYSNLLNWYLIQGRRDLYDELLTNAKQMLPDLFVDEPPAHHTQEPLEAEVIDESILPEDTDELLNLVWQTGDPRRTAALERAVDLQQSRQLHWYQVARLIACRLLLPDYSGGELADPQSLLPERPPGAPHWFGEVLCEALTDYSPSIRAALAVDRWLVRIVPNYEDYSELWFKRVLLLEHAQKMEEALEELEKLLKRYPATSSALYRMGLVKYRQQDFPSAREHFQKALEVNPGLFGAMELLRDVHLTLDERDEQLRCTKMLRRKMPYSVACFKDELFAVAEIESPEAAERLLAESAADFPERLVSVLRARLDLANDRVAAATDRLAQIALSPDDDDDSFEECLSAKLHVAMSVEDVEATIALCDQGLQRWPNSTRLLEIKAEQLRSSDPDESCKILREVLCDGEPRAETVRQYLQVADQLPDVAVRELIADLPESQRQSLVELFSEVMGQTDLLQHNEPFLTWALARFPESDQLRFRLVSHFNVTGQTQKAMPLAEELYKRNPDDVQAAWMLGRCLMDLDGMQALPYLEKVCEQDGSVDNLFDLARCHQIVGNNPRARQLHWDILQQNPYVSSSWTNLYLLNGTRARLWPFLVPMLDHGRGVNDEYFLVAAVKTAVGLKKRLPTSWFPLAIQRWEVLQTYPGFQDERRRLKRALLAWVSRRPQDITEGITVPRDSLESFVATVWWPRSRWIPQA